MSNFSDYQHYIAMSRYSRYLPEEQRRETWEESVRRYCAFFKSQHPEFPEDRVFEYIYNLKSMPSMRALMTAGPALARDNSAGYNCSYIAIDNTRAFDEAMYLLMCGVGVGYSVERQFITKLPFVAEEFYDSDTVISVKDSRIGWASSLKELISLLYQGLVPKWDLSKLRKSGEPLKTFGGRSSGPNPLNELFQYAVYLFKSAAGRKLNSIECNDLMCKIGEIVVVGGVRRSACICLSNLSDDRMRSAKSGQWWIENPQRALANISVAYTEKPSVGQFMEEWMSLYQSKSGERGIFNRVAAVKKMQDMGRRDSEPIKESGGTNPCVTGDTMVLTSTGTFTVDQLIGVDFEVPTVDGSRYLATNGFWKTGTKPVYKLTTSKGYTVKATEDHKVLTTEGWVEMGNLTNSHMVVLNSGECILNRNKEEFDLGWIVGQVIGDGCYNPEKYKGLVRFWGNAGLDLATRAFHIIESIEADYHQPTKPLGPIFNKHNNTYQVQSKKIDDLCSGLIDRKKNILATLETKSHSFIAGVISGLFDADGTIGGNTKKQGIYLQLSQSNRHNLEAVQRMLVNFGIVSTIRLVREAGEHSLPNGRGSLSEYYCGTQYRLDISRDCIDKFANYIDFCDSEKKQQLDSLLQSRTKTPYKTKYEDKVISVDYAGIEDVYDCTVDEYHAFSANGIVVHNCGEIVLRSCQFCNLTEVVIRAEDTLNDLLDKVEVATIMGTFQSTLTDFRYLRSIWKKNTDEERLLGVSLTGIMDHEIMSGKVSKEQLKGWLTTLREKAIEVNKEWSAKLGINQSVSVTTVKPSGTVSQLVDSSSGIHPRYSQYYIRTVRNDKKDPLSQFLIDQGVAHEPDVTKPESTYVFSFPMKSPVGATTTKEVNAIDQLELYLIYNKYWSEHNISITAYLQEHEWLKVGAWVYDHFNEINGISFLPYSDHVYRQAPYQPISKEKYDELTANVIPVDWSKFSVKEHDDNTAGIKEYACTGGACEIV